MFILDPGRSLAAAELQSTAATLRSLADDMDRLASGGFPRQEDLARAPILDAYEPILTPTPCLTGAVTGHPILEGEGRIITTSPVYLIDRVHGWARTHSRLYRLGRPQGSAQRQS